jgi:hypothetical protein
MDMLLKMKVKLNRKLKSNQILTKYVVKSEQQFKPRPSLRYNREKNPDNYFEMNKHMLTIMKNWYPLKFKLAYPKLSSLDSSQQKEFIELNDKFSKSTELKRSEMKNYKRYMVSLIYFFLFKLFLMDLLLNNF